MGRSGVDYSPAREAAAPERLRPVLHPPSERARGTRAGRRYFDAPDREAGGLEARIIEEPLPEQYVVEGRLPGR